MGAASARSCVFATPHATTVSIAVASLSSLHCALQAMASYSNSRRDFCLGVPHCSVLTCNHDRNNHHNIHNSNVPYSFEAFDVFVIGSCVFYRLGRLQSRKNINSVNGRSLELQYDD